MTALPCPRCGEIGFTWSINEDTSNFTQWRCSLCGYSAREDESTQTACVQCRAAVATLLEDTTGSYRYCSSCRSIWSGPPQDPMNR